jgi:hypothetical protein
VRGDESVDVYFEVAFDFVEGNDAAVDERAESLLSLFQIIGQFGGLKQPFLETLHADHVVVFMWAMTIACVSATHAGIGCAAGFRADDEDGSVVSATCE